MIEIPQYPSHPLLEARQQLKYAENLRLTKKYEDCQKLCKQIIRRYPTYSAAFHTLGLACADQQDFDQALINLIKASMLNPNEPRILTALAGVYLRLGANQMAKSTLQEAQGLSADEISVLVTLGELYREEREYELAAEAFAKINDIDPSFGPAYLGLGQCLVHLGKLSAASRAFEKLVHAGNRTVGVLYSLSQIPPELRRIDPLALIPDATPDPGQSEHDFLVLKSFANAALLDQAGQHKEAWKVVQKSNEMVATPAMADMIKSVSFRARLLEDVKAYPVTKKQDQKLAKDDTQTLFILGPSRAGKTTLERLVASCSGVKRGFENPSVENAVKQAFLSDAFPPLENILEMPPPLDLAFERFYQADINSRANGAKLFTNTHPGLVQSVLRLGQAIPNARFVFVKRNIEDIVLRIYQKKFRVGNFHSYNLAAIHEYILWYYEMIDLLAARLPDRARIIQYEDMIKNPVQAMNTAAELCTLATPKNLGFRPGDDQNCAAPYHAVLQELTQFDGPA